MSDDDQNLTRAEVRRRAVEQLGRSERRELRQQRRATIKRRAVMGGGLVIALVATIALATALHLNGNISRVDIASGSGERPSDADGDLNILVIGSDTRFSARSRRLR